MGYVTLGFIYLILPFCAALFYATPSKYKGIALSLISCFVYIQMDFKGIYLIASLLLDTIFFCVITKGLLKDLWGEAIYYLSIAKTVAVLIYVTPNTIGASVIAISSIFALAVAKKGELTKISPIEYFCALSFFPRFPIGPIDDTKALMVGIKGIKPSLSSIGKGILQFSVGLGKYVIISKQLFILFATLENLTDTQISVGSIWLTALTMAMGFYFAISGFGDMAQGLGAVFSLSIPRITYYPFHSPSVRDYIYRYNMPLQTALGIFLFDDYDREKNHYTSFAVSMLMPFVVVMCMPINKNAILWACFMSILATIDCLAFSRIKINSVVFSRAFTFIVTLPSYLLFLDTTITNKLNLMVKMFFINGLELYNDELLYIVSTNGVLIIVACIFCLSLFETISRLTYTQMPALWWAMSVIFSILVLMVSTSFILWNVR